MLWVCYRDLNPCIYDGHFQSKGNQSGKIEGNLAVKREFTKYSAGEGVGQAASPLPNQNPGCLPIPGAANRLSTYLQHKELEANHPNHSSHLQSHHGLRLTSVAAGAFTHTTNKWLLLLHTLQVGAAPGNMCTVEALTGSFLVHNHTKTSTV